MKYKLIYWWISRHRWYVSAASPIDHLDINEAHHKLIMAQYGRKDVFYKVIECNADCNVLPPPTKELIDAL